MSFFGFCRLLLSFLKSLALNFSICKLSCKDKKYLNLEPKMSYLGIFGMKIENTVVLLEISALEFAYLQTLV